jgi:hypothetical protein
MPERMSETAGIAESFAASSCARRIAKRCALRLAIPF